MDDAQTPQQKAILTVGDRTAEFPVLHGTDGVPSIDVATFTRQTGYTALDYGFVNTASTKSAGGSDPWCSSFCQRYGKVFPW